MICLMQVVLLLLDLATVSLRISIFKHIMTLSLIAYLPTEPLIMKPGLNQLFTVKQFFQQRRLDLRNELCKYLY